MPAMPELFFTPPDYSRLIEAVRELALSLPALMGTLDDDTIKIALGERAGIWPDTILGDLDAENYRDRLSGRLPTPAGTHEALHPLPAGIVPAVADPQS